MQLPGLICAAQEACRWVAAWLLLNSGAAVLGQGCIRSVRGDYKDSYNDRRARTILKRMVKLNSCSYLFKGVEIYAV